MWGNHLLDMYQHANFNLSFPHDLTRNPSRLIQWQYWWWFWFSSIFVLYYFVLTKVLLKRALKFRPKIVTSYRAHGRWGDIVVAVVPIFWCFNILSHSTLLLRMSEFQTETNIMTVRVRGRQWYWIYKLELANFFSLANKKTLINSQKQLSVITSLRGGVNAVFVNHHSYRQYWRNWFLNKSTFFYNNKGIVSEIVTPENNLNDVGVTTKSKNLKLKTQRLKPSWYGKNLDSNNNLTSVHLTKHNNSFYGLSKTFKPFIMQSIITETLKENLTALLKHSNNLNLSEKLLNSLKNTNTFDLNLLKLSAKPLPIINHQSGVFQNKSYFFRDNTSRILNEPTIYLSLNVSGVLPANSHSNADFLYSIFSVNGGWKPQSTKNFLEFFKLLNVTYQHKNNGLYNLLNRINVFKGLKEPVKYTFDLKPKFGYTDTKLNLICPAMINQSLSDVLKVLILQPELECEQKNLNTVIRYFMVLDQNRRILNRVIKSPKNEFINRNSIINSLYNTEAEITKIGFNYQNHKKIFLPIPLYNEKGELNYLEGNDATHVAGLLKNKVSFINSSKLIKETNSHELDYFSPIKYNSNSEVSNTQTNVRGKKKLLHNQRLLHTTSILVLPTKLNITVITNSYDVIHSWFIPGLGLKMDAVPGRSTHHTLYIDHPGIYYGQCAEICGRFHHHMPIKIAAIQWEHFLLWWYHHTMNLGVHGFLKDLNRSSLKEFKTHKVYPVTSRFLNQRPAI